METEPHNLLSILTITNFELPLNLMFMIILLIISALVSGSEVAFFSLSPTQLNRIKSTGNNKHQLIDDLLQTPEKLLATILITNNLVNVGIIILSNFLSESLINTDGMSELEIKIYQIGVVTFLLLLFGEIIPKVYASYFSLQFSYYMAYPMKFLTKFFNFLSTPLVNSSSIFKKKFVRTKYNISIDDLSEALDLTKQHIKDEKKILEGIVKFAHTEAKEIITPRVDVVAIDIKYSLSKLLEIIVNSEYSRIPVYSKTFDNIKGILYIKDLLGHIDEDNNFKWEKLIRKPYIIPESKKISDLLSEFQQNKIHLAIVVDEYGGTSGIVTLEDVMEEILGDITDENDTEVEDTYQKINDTTYLFEGKTMLNDFCKIIEVDDEFIEKQRGDADTLAGFLLELIGEIPRQGTEIKYKNMVFKIHSVNPRRIKKIEVKIT